MNRWRRFFVVLGVLALGASAHADMRPLSCGDPGISLSTHVSVTVPGQDADQSNPLDGLGMTDPIVLPGESLPDVHEAGETVGGTQPAKIQSDGQSSFGLCLYALLGLGVCRSVPLVKKLSFGYIPQWYHDGGPLQVGHSHAISPDCLYDSPVCCFVQPDGGATDRMLLCRHGTIVVLWRKSQFAPLALALRGPPVSS